MRRGRVAFYYTAPHFFAAGLDAFGDLAAGLAALGDLAAGLGLFFGVAFLGAGLRVNVS